MASAGRGMCVRGNLSWCASYIDRDCGVIVLTGLVMAAEANTTLRHSMTEIAGGHCELAVRLLYVGK